MGGWGGLATAPGSMMFVGFFCSQPCWDVQTKKKIKTGLIHFAFEDFRSSTTVGQKLKFVNNKGRCYMVASHSGLFALWRSLCGVTTRNTLHQPLKLHWGEAFAASLSSCASDCSSGGDGCGKAVEAQVKRRPCTSSSCDSEHQGVLLWRLSRFARSD